MPSDGAEASSNVSVSHRDPFVNTFFENFVITIEICAQCPNLRKITALPKSSMPTLIDILGLLWYYKVGTF